MKHLSKKQLFFTKFQAQKQHGMPQPSLMMIPGQHADLEPASRSLNRKTSTSRHRVSLIMD